MLKRLLVLTLMLLAAPAFAEEEAKWTTDPYPLLTDPTGASLADVEAPIVVLHEGRELRFATQENADTYAEAPAKHLAAVDKLIIAEQSKHYPLTVCPISNEPLDAMGKPLQRVYGNRLVQFCCASCAKQFTKNPTPVIKQLDEAVIAQQAPVYAGKTCPVSGGKIGSMGESVKYVFANRLVEFCCEGCVEPFKQDVTKYLPELPSVKVEAAP